MRFLGRGVPRRRAIVLGALGVAGAGAAAGLLAEHANVFWLGWESPVGSVEVSAGGRVLVAAALEPWHPYYALAALGLATAAVAALWPARRRAPRPGA